jgi:phosphate acetyltransferase
MSKAIYIATNENNSGKSILVLGLMSMVMYKTAKVGYYRPIIDNVEEGKQDNHLKTVLDYFKLNTLPEEAYAFTKSKFIALLNNNEKGKIFNKIIEKYKKLEEQYDFILVEGTDFSGEGSAVELNYNGLIAKNLGIPAIIVSKGVNKTQDRFVSDLKLAYDSFVKKNVEVVGLVANKIQEKNLELVASLLKKNFPEKLYNCVIPLIESLDHPSIKEVAAQINGKVLIGHDLMNNECANSTVGAMQLSNYITKLKNNCLVITPGDRADLILGALQANLSSNYPSVAGIILTGGLVPEPSIIKLIEGLQKVVPIVLVEEGTFETANKVGAVRSHIYAENEQKIQQAIQVFEKNFDFKKMEAQLVSVKSKDITPRMFQYNMIQRAKKIRKNIVLPEGNDDRILMAAAKLCATDILDLTILGKESEIKERIAFLEIELDLSKITIIDPLTSHHLPAFSEKLFELRKHKGLTINIARDLMEDPSYFGTMMVYKGMVDGMVAGATQTTKNTILPALQFIKTTPNASIVSSIFFMYLKDRVSIFGDCAINPNPNAEELAAIAISSAASAKAFGIEPKIAMLSYSSGSSGSGEDVERVKEATAIVKQRNPELNVEGPIQYDAAVDPEVGKKKMPNSEVAGQANVLIFPDLNTGNNTYKAVQRETGGLAIGPILQGLKKPVNDLSRGCNVDDIYNTVIITAIQAQGI